MTSMTVYFKIVLKQLIMTLFQLTVTPLHKSKSYKASFKTDFVVVPEDMMIGNLALDLLILFTKWAV